MFEWLQGIMPKGDYFKENYKEILFSIICLVGLIMYMYITLYTTSRNLIPDGINTPAADQAKKLLAYSDPKKNSKRAIVYNLPTMNAPSSLINFYALGCRYSGYIGPMENGYFNSDIAIQHSVNLGCRVFVLDIDYYEGNGITTTYIPRICVQDVQGKNMIQFNDKYKLNDPVGEIRRVCESINTYAFSSACQNAADPVIIVLYFHRKPPGSKNDTAVLTYYSKVAEALGPFQNRLITNEVHNGVFHRQKQEDNLLYGNITNYTGRVLIFSNADTSGFRDSIVPYQPYKDLDFLVNLRLSYTETALGITEKDTPSFGILQSVDNYTSIPADRMDAMKEQTKKKWTICLSSNPSIPVSPEIYNKITSLYGINCVPAFLFDTEASSFLFAANLFEKNGYIPKPCPDPKTSSCLCYIPPAIAVPGLASATMNSDGGNLPSPIPPGSIGTTT